MWALLLFVCALANGACAIASLSGAVDPGLALGSAFVSGLCFRGFLQELLDA